MKKILSAVLICITASLSISAQNNCSVSLEDKGGKETDCLVSEYDYVIVFNAFFCKTCVDKQTREKRILMICNENQSSKTFRISTCNSLRKLYPDSDIRFVKTPLSISLLKTNALLSGEEFCRILASKEE